MTSSNPKVIRIRQKLDRLKSVRQQYESEWSEVRSLIRPYGKDPTASNTPGDSRVQEVYDSTALQAAVELSAGLHTFVANPIEPWCKFTVADTTYETSEDEKRWLQQAADAVHKVYATDKSYFHTAIHEAFRDLPTFGTGYVSQEWSKKDGCPKFRSHAAAACWIELNWEGEVSTVYREAELTLDQIVEQFEKEGGLSEEFRKDHAAQPYKAVCVIHAVEPRREYDAKKHDALNMPFSSCWVLPDYDLVLRESGYREQVYHPMRWEVLADEIYGRSPAMVVLPDVRVLNAMERTILRAASKVVDPPILAEDDDVMSELDISPGAVNFIENIERRPIPLETGVNIPLGLELSEQKRNAIRRGLHSDWLQLEKKNIEMTATEVVDRRDEKLRLLAPTLGRLQAETLGPLVMRTLNLLIENGRLPAPPGNLGKSVELTVVYTSPAAQAQLRGKSMILERFVQSVLPIGQLKPEALDRINFDNLVKIMGDVQDVPRMAMYSDEELQRQQEARQAKENAAIGASTALDASAALKNISQARETGMDVTSLLPALGG